MKQPALTDDQAASLVQGEEHRLLIRHGQAAIPEKARGALIKKVGKAPTFEKAVEIIGAHIAKMKDD